MGFDAYAWLLTDPGTSVGTAPIADVPWLPELPRLIRLKYSTPVNRWTTLGAPVALLHEKTGGDLSRSLLWRELLGEYGVRDVASVVYRDRFGCWGFLELWRFGERPFGPAEAAFLAESSGPLTAALRRCQAATFSQPVHGQRRVGPVVLLLSPELQVRSQTPETAAYLPVLVPPSPEREPVPASAYNVAAQLCAVEAGVDDNEPSARVHLSGGLWLTLRAARISGRGSPTGRDIAVTIEQASPSERLDLFARAFGLSARESELLALPGNRRGHCGAGAADVPLRSHRPGPSQVGVRQDLAAQPPRPACQGHRQLIGSRPPTRSLPRAVVTRLRRPPRRCWGLTVDSAAVLRAYDEQVRQRPDADRPGVRVEREGGVVRVVATGGGWSGVTWSDLDEATVDAAVAAQGSRFRGLSGRWEWKLYGYDRPVDLPRRLVAAGLTPGPVEALMVAEVADLALDATPPPGVELLPVLDEQGVARLVRVHDQVFGADHAALGTALAADLVQRPGTVAAVLALARGQAVAAGRVELPGGTEFASLWGGGTLSEWRGRGVFRSLVAYRAALAAAAGFRYLQVDASADSRPVLRRLGFVQLTTTTPFTDPGVAT